MKRIFPRPDEFYIGYLPTAPKGGSSFLKRVVLVGFAFFLILGTALVGNQKDFATSEFEYGVNTTLSGVLVKTPVPHLQISLGKTSKGEELFQSVLLVGSGKFGAHELLKTFSPDVRVTLQGFLIYGDGKALVQVNDINNILLSENNKTNIELKTPEASNGKFISVRGEITDPKCYFGVMKPGEGKTHRSCAIRCISGGIPPVLKTNSSDYFLLLNENLQPLNDDVLGIVGDQVELDGEVTELDDWKILRIDSKKIRALSKSIQLKKQLVAMEDKMTFCNHSSERK